MNEFSAADLIQKVRESLRLNKSMFAKSVGVSPSTITRIESGKLDPTYSMLNNIVSNAGFTLEHNIESAGTSTTPTNGGNMPATLTSMLDLNHISKSFGKKLIIKDFSYRFEAGKKVFITGKNGSGKTTLINIILGFAKSDTGTVQLNCTKEDVGIVFQKSERDHFLNVKNELTIGEILHPGSDITPYQEFLGIEDFSTRLNTLSGGEWQKLQVVKTLAASPQLLVTDEITTGLDYLAREELYQLLAAHFALHQSSYLSVSHYEEEINAFGDIVLHMSKGKVHIIDNSDHDFSFKKVAAL